MIWRTALLVVALGAVSLAVAQATAAGALPDLEEAPPLPSQEEPPLPGPLVSVHAEAEVALAPFVHVVGEASVDVGPEEPPAGQDASSARPEEPGPPAVEDGPADEVVLGSDADEVRPVAAIAAATAAFGLLAALTFGMEAVRTGAAYIGAHLLRVLRGAARLALLLPLFSRIPRTKLLDNRVRASIHAAVAANPGISLTNVTSGAGIAWGTAVHHLQKLEVNGLIVSANKRAHRRFFLTGTAAALRRDDIAVMAHPTARRIAALVSVQPGIDQTGICKALRLNNPAASKHLRGFEAQGLVMATREGRSRLYHPTPAMVAALPYVPGMPAQTPGWTQQHVPPITMAAVA